MVCWKLIFYFCRFAVAEMAPHVIQKIVDVYDDVLNNYSGKILVIKGMNNWLPGGGGIKLFSEP